MISPKVLIIKLFATNSEIIGVNLIKIGPEMTSGYLFEKMWFYMKYIVNFLSGNRYMAHHKHQNRKQVRNRLEYAKTWYNLKG